MTNEKTYRIALEIILLHATYGVGEGIIEGIASVARDALKTGDQQRNPVKKEVKWYEESP